MADIDDALNDLKNMVTAIRERLTDEFTAQLQETYGIQPDGTILPLEDAALVDPQERAVAQQLRESIAHYGGTPEASAAQRKKAVQRTIREQAFTVLNRFAALRMAEQRDLVVECVAQGYESAGFRVYDRVAGSSLGATTYERYRVYLECLFDELALDLGVLFDRYAPEGLLFPREKALLDVLGELNADALASVWTEDETIGWIYQYFHPKTTRKQMRDDSSTPRNSREMAVRNQLFTPRYVVQFLVDNTLGRFWHEMTRGNTRITDDLDYFVPRENEVFLGPDEKPPAPEDASQAEDTYVAPHRPRKAPHEIRLLDPACGSMHFGMYAFDLFEQMYLEAWDRFPDLRAALQKHLRDDRGLDLSNDDRAAFRREVPRLIVERNLHGIDIDRRAAQIAGVALWLRAQRAWSNQGIDAVDRPRIRQSGIVCAEPMPGEAHLREAYLDSLADRGPEGRLLGELVEVIWDRMAIAGEAGPLLKIEQEIEEVLSAAYRQFKTRQREGVQGGLFGDGLQQGELDFDTEGVREQFFEQAESLLLDALRTFASDRTEGSATRRRLFADDAARGFAFLDLMHRGGTTGFDVIVMNPPFGEASQGAEAYVDANYPASKVDVYQAFVDRAEELLVPAGYVGAITSRTGFFLTASQPFRERIMLERYHPQLFADFGHGVLDALVETAAFTLRTRTEAERLASTQRLLDDLVEVQTTSTGKFSVPKYMRARGMNPQSTVERPIADQELDRLHRAGYLDDATSSYTQYTHNHEAIQGAREQEVARLPGPSVLCFRLIDVEDEQRAERLFEMVAQNGPRFQMSPDSISNVPESPFAYWVTDGVRNLFDRRRSLGDVADAKSGLCTGRDYRFIRLWWEVSPETICPPEVHPDEWNGPYCVSSDSLWFPIAKGGAFSPYFSDVHLLVKWKADGCEIRSGADQNTLPGARPQNTQFYFRPALTWTNSTSSRFSIRVLPRGCIFSHVGQSVFFEEVNSDMTFSLGMMNADPFIGMMSIMLGLAEAGRKHYEVGTVKKVPFPEDTSDAVGRAALKGNRTKQHLASRSSTAKLYGTPALLQDGATLRPAVQSEAERTVHLEAELRSVQRTIDREVYDLYGLSGEDQASIEIALNQQSVGSDGHAEDDDWDAADVLDTEALVHDLISYAVGVCFGRYDIRYATGERDLPEIPGPFDPLPVCSPGMLTGDDGLPLETPPDGYPVSFPETGILVENDRPGALSERIRTVLEHIYGPEDAARVEHEAMDVLGEDTLEGYLRNPNRFFDDHKSAYSKSRRRAPIYWPLQVPSRQYTLWLYYPRLTSETLYTCLNDHLAPLLNDDVEPRLQELRRRAQEGDTSVRDELDDLETLAGELAALQDALLEVAELPYHPNQNDGVELTAAPLHDLFQHTMWSRRLSDYWDELCDGAYDWAHLAAAIWPDRVKDACRRDRSIAIAHEKEALYDGD